MSLDGCAGDRIAARWVDRHQPWVDIYGQHEGIGLSKDGGVGDFGCLSSWFFFTPLGEKELAYNKPSSCARSTASSRLWTPSLPKIWLVWALTVLIAIESAPAI
jgi:hypothetical protein